MTVAESVKYVETLVATYLRLAGRTRLTGAVAELGVGDNLGTLLLLKERGATEAVAVDRYRPRADPDVQRAVYVALAQRHGIDGIDLGDPDLDLGVTTEYGAAAEDYFEHTATKFEGIVSWSVLEHLYDPLAALTSMQSALAPNGFMVHSVDLRDHGTFGDTRHPLQFLSIPSVIYPYLVRNRGGPNRVLLNSYRDWLSTSGATGSLLIHGLVGNDRDVGGVPWDEIPSAARDAALKTVGTRRRRFAPAFRDISDEDLAVSGFQLVVHA